MIRKFFGLNLDFAGAATASICALHCAAFPVLISLGIISGASHNHLFDLSLMFIGIVIAGIILIKDFTSIHRNILPIAIAGIGFIALFAGIESHGEQVYLNLIGGGLIVLSHYTNWRISNNFRKIQKA